MTDEDRVNEAMIAQYRSELVAEAELARADLDEIEDHLRTLITELRDIGMPRAEAIAEACRRLGEPKQLAREHARVRSPFGPRLSRARAWSAAALLLPFVAVFYNTMWRDPRASVVSTNGFELLLGTVMLAGVIARQSWARAIVLGSLVTTVVWNGAFLCFANDGVDTRFAMVLLGCYGGAVFFLMPWRRGELTDQGFALVLLGPAFAAAMTSFQLLMTGPHGVVLGNPAAAVALVGVLAAGLGGVLRGRFGAIAAGIAALALSSATADLWSMTVRMDHPALFRALLLGSLVGGALAAATSAVLLWRGARGAIGTLQGVVE